MNEVIENMNKHEASLAPYATKNKDAIRLFPEAMDIRPSFFRDIDRIIYCLSYTRYIDKTQVFSNSKNDHISKRMTHVQMVSKIARTISRALNLNEDLTEAIALGHDLGHVPFGHPGEAILNRISQEKTGRMFQHNVHSVRVLKDLEEHGKGSNITIQVLDGILCHNGEFVSHEYFPVPRSKEEFLNLYEQCYVDKNLLKTLHPMTLEGCVVRISDVIAYIGRDIEDAIRIGAFSKEQIPERIVQVLGSTNREMINTIILDIIENSLNKPYIKMSDSVYQAVKDLKDFNYHHIYEKANTSETLNQYENMFRFLFDKYLEDIANHNTESAIFQVFLKDMCPSYLEETSPEQKVIDFIAGMTDDYFQEQFHINQEKKKELP